jgi:two-component system, OmpR family, phosphate regulon sensor histidine kinase PhoR
VQPIHWLFLALMGLCVWLWRRLRTTENAYDRTHTTLAEQKQLIQTANHALQNAKDLSQGLIQAAFDGLIIVDSEQIILGINQVAADLFQISPAKAQGQTFISVSQNHELERLLQMALDGEDPPESQANIHEGTYRVRIVLLGGQQQQRAGIILQNVTELLRLSRARRDMVANLSHDLLTPVSNIRLLVDTLQNTYGRNPDRDKEKLLKIASVAESLQHMMRELVDLSTIESGQAITRMVNISFSQIVNEALNMMEAQIDEKKHTILNTLPEAFVLADPEQIRRVVNNIVQNAIKFSPTKGEIHISAIQEGDVLKVSIQDTGPGIPPQERQRIFERFYQVDSPRTGGAAGRGSGLGLAIAKHIVEAHGGRIWVEAAIPVGSIFHFTLLLSKQNTQA